MVMKRMTMLIISTVAVAILAAACGDGDDTGNGDPPAPSTTTDSIDTTSGEAAPVDGVAEIMAAALHQLVTVDNTFGGGDVFDLHLVLDHTDPSAGDGLGAERPLTDGEMAAITETLDPRGEVMFIENADDWRTDDLMPTKDGSVILGVGEPEIDGSTARVGVSLWCGGLCGTWFTYSVEKIEGIWQVTGIDGPVAIS